MPFDSGGAPLQPLLSLPITINPGDRDKFHSAVTDLRRQFRALHTTLRVRSLPDTHVVHLEGQSEAQLDDLAYRLRNDFAIDFTAGPPAVVLIETLRKSAEAEGKYIRQTGGSGNYAHVKIRLQPNEAGRGFEFLNQIIPGVIPDGYLKPIEEGIRKAAEGGILAGCDVVDFRAILYDGSYHAADSNEMAFMIAGSLAFKEAARRANPVLLEPVMKFEFTVPESQRVALIHSLRVQHVEVTLSEQNKGGSRTMWAIAPLESMLGFHTPAPDAISFVGYRERPRPDTRSDEGGAPVRNPWKPRPRSDATAAEAESEWN